MSPIEADAIRQILTSLIVAGGFLTGLGMVLRHRRGREASPPAQLGELTQAVEALRVSVEGMRHELSEVQERLDFAERLLAQATQQPKELRRS